MVDRLTIKMDINTSLLISCGTLRTKPCMCEKESPREGWTAAGQEKSGGLQKELEDEGADTIKHFAHSLTVHG